MEFYLPLVNKKSMDSFFFNAMCVYSEKLYYITNYDKRAVLNIPNVLYRNFINVVAVIGRKLKKQYPKCSFVYACKNI